MSRCYIYNKIFWQHFPSLWEMDIHLQRSPMPLGRCTFRKLILSLLKKFIFLCNKEEPFCIWWCSWNRCKNFSFLYNIFWYYVTLRFIQFLLRQIKPCRNVHVEQGYSWHSVCFLIIKAISLDVGVIFFHCGVLYRSNNK